MSRFFPPYCPSGFSYDHTRTVNVHGQDVSTKVCNNDNWPLPDNGVNLRLNSLVQLSKGNNAYAELLKAQSLNKQITLDEDDVNNIGLQCGDKDCYDKDNNPTLGMRSKKMHKRKGSKSRGSKRKGSKRRGSKRKGSKRK